MDGNTKPRRKIIEIKTILPYDLYERYVQYIRAEGFSIREGTLYLIEQYVKAVEDDMRKNK